MSKETAPSEKTKKDGLTSHDEIQASVRDQGKDFDDENQVPHEGASQATSEEYPEALANREASAEANDDEKNIKNPPEPDDSSVERAGAEAQQNTPPLEEPEQSGGQNLVNTDDKAEASLPQEEPNDQPPELSGERPVDKEATSEKVALSPDPGDANASNEGEKTSADQPEVVQVEEQTTAEIVSEASAPDQATGPDAIEGQPEAHTPDSAVDEEASPAQAPEAFGQLDMTGTEDAEVRSAEHPSAIPSGDSATTEKVSDTASDESITTRHDTKGQSEESTADSPPDEVATHEQVPEASSQHDTTNPEDTESHSTAQPDDCGSPSPEHPMEVSSGHGTLSATAHEVDKAQEQVGGTETASGEAPVAPTPTGEAAGTEPASGSVAPDSQQTEASSKTSSEAAGGEDQVEEHAAGDSTGGKMSIPEEIEITNNKDDIHDDGDELVHADYSQYSKEELVATIKKLTKIDDFKKLDLVLNIIDPLFQDIKQADRKVALDKYLAEGGSEEDFAYKNELDQKYDAYYKLIKERKNKFYGDLGRQKLENYQKATELLEKLRHLVDGEESTTSINAIKEIQEQWKAIGQVPPQHVRNLWASYNALMDRFYDNRSIYFELKELDRRKNLSAKEELCVRAEKLEDVKNLKDAIKELNELHNEYKHIGPVPKAQQEALWQRFKAASDKVYARRKTYYDDLKKDLEVNLEAKAKLRDEVQPFAAFDSDRIVDWNKKTQEILGIQKRWEAIGGLPRDRAQEINKPFWSAFKRFFNNKNSFFKKLEGQREENLKLKEALVAKAHELKDSTDWNQTANELKKLQNEWRNIGPVPEKHRNEVYQRFKRACDFFFENRRNRFKEVEKEYEKNLKLKEDVCQRILKLAEEGAGDIGQLEVLQEEWNNIGFVPKNAIRSSQEMFAKAVDQFIASSSLDEDEKNKLKITTKLTSLKGTPNANRKLNKKEFTLRRQITNLENDISLWKNNLEFFANSKNADQVREEFDEKIEKAKKQLRELKAQLKIIRDI
ncbi:MAG: DUF349 domain-containing protein [Cytophagales bacterium]|nr:DUF349 domain-containing protein [Cytophagales bacterium]